MASGIVPTSRPIARIGFRLAPTVVGASVLCGCLSQEAIQRIEGTPEQEGTGIFLSRLPEVIKILATYEATDRQRKVTTELAQRVVTALQQDGEGGPLPDRIAIETAPDDRLQGKAAVMLWDTQTEQIVGNKVYDVEETPKEDKVGRWESYTATFYRFEFTGGG